MAVTNENDEVLCHWLFALDRVVGDPPCLMISCWCCCGGVIACSSGPLGFVTTCCQQRQEDVLTAFIVVVQRGITHMESPPHRFRRKEKIDSAYTQSNVVNHLTRAVFCANEERRKQTASAMEWVKATKMKVTRPAHTKRRMRASERKAEARRK